MTEPETSHIEYWVMGFNHGINQERERIIKLLETNCKPNDHDYNGGCNCDVIALVKGVNK